MENNTINQELINEAVRAGMPIPADALKTTQEQQTEENAQAQQEQETVDISKLIKVQRLEYTKDGYVWIPEVLEKLDAPTSKNNQIAIICKIFDATYTMANSKYEVIRDKTIIDDYKLRAIFNAVIGAKLTDATVQYFRVKGWVVPAKLSTKSCYFVTPKLQGIYDSISESFVG